MAKIAENGLEIDQKLDPVYYHALHSSQAALYRLVRLSALSEAPSQFGSTFARELAFTSEQWKDRLSNPDAITFVATTQSVLEERDPLLSSGWDQPAKFEASDLSHYGIVVCIKSFEDPTDAFIVSFWVSPSGRRRGIGQALLQKALIWAKSYESERRTFKAVLLDVNKGNLAARRVYERCGFITLSENPDDAEGLRYIYHLE